MHHHGLIIVAFQLMVAGCADHLAGPNEPVLVGQFGSANSPVELLATRSGVELELGCAAYFASTEPPRLDADGAFRLRGQHHSSGNFNDATGGATLLGQVAAGQASVSVNLTVDGAGATTDPFTATLHADTHDADSQVCPA